MTGDLKSPSFNGATVVLGIKINANLDSLIQNMANQETKGNKSEMIRTLLLEAIERRNQIEEMLTDMENEIEECSGEN